MLAKKATVENNKIKIMVWGEPGAGKTRFALSAPNPLLVDLENGSNWYGNEFDFLVAKKDETNLLTKNATVLTKNIIDEIIKGEYKDIKTLIIDPVTDLLENIETLCISIYEKQALKGNKQVLELNALEKSKFYSFRRDKSREMIDRILSLDLNIIFIARSKNVWGKSDGQMTVIGKTFDGIDILEYLTDVVINLKKVKGEIIAEVKKGRIGQINDTIDIKDWNSISEYISNKYKVIEMKNKQEAV